MFEPQNEPILYTDTETFNTVDLKEAGTVKYCLSAEMLLAAFELDGEYHAYDYVHNPVIPDWVHQHINSGGIVCAHNMLFDYVILKKHIPALRIEQCMDSMALCAAHGLPLALAKAGKVLGLATQKYDGGALVRRFCIPRKPSKHDARVRITPQDDPVKWIEFRDEYLDGDIYSMKGIIEKLGVLTTTEQQYWVDTQVINLKGVPVDVETTQLIHDKIDQLVDDESSKFIRLTGLFPTQRDKVLGWVRTQGVRVLNLQAATVEEIVGDPDTPALVKEALECRANTTHMSFKKYKTILDAVCDDETVKGTLMYHAAHTGRWGGRLLQTQNLTKGHIDGNEAVARIQAGEFSVELVKSALRGMIYHPHGFAIGDYSQIEARITQWMCDDQDALEVFRSGKDPYKTFGVKMYNIPFDDISDEQRFTAKQAVLGLGFQMAYKRFMEMCKGYGVAVSQEDAELAVKIYRTTHKKLVKFWGQMNKAAVMAVHQPDTLIKVNQFISFFMTDDFLYMVLPSGRQLAYYQPTITLGNWDNESVSYMGVNDKNQWVRVNTFGGKLTENAAQGIARDIMAGAVSKLLTLGYEVPTHVHDEAVVVDQEELDNVLDVMTIVPEWAAGLPLEADGFMSPRFRKG